MRLRPGWPLVLLLVLVVVVPIVEVYLLVQVGHRIGFWPTLAILVAEGVLGGWLMQREGSRAWSALSVAFSKGRVPTGELADAALVLVGGLCLLLPGFLTDVIGLFFLLPFTRPFARKALAFFVARRLSRRPVRPRSGPGTGDVIEGEVVRPADATGPQGEIEDGPPSDRAG